MSNRKRIVRSTGLPVRTSKEIYLMRKELGITNKQAAYNKFRREMATVN